MAITQRLDKRIGADMIKDGELNLDMEDEIISGAMFTHNGEITHEPTKAALNQ